MFSSVKWISKLLTALFTILVLTSSGWAQIHVLLQRQSLLPADEAREMFNNGVTLYDQYRFNDAELRFREVIRRFPKNIITDRADYYLIRTLAQMGRKTDALTRIDGFAKQYPNSKWLDDVQELRIQLTNEIPPKADRILLRVSAPPSPQSPSPAPGPFGTRIQSTEPARAPFPPLPPLPPGPAFLFGPGGLQNSDPELSLQQEIMAVVFRTNFDRALEIATERLKANPADPVVLSSLHLVAANRSAPALSLLVGIAKDSPNPKARRDAIFWLAQSSRGDREDIVNTLISLIPSLTDGDSEAVAFSLAQIRSEKSLNALAALARDKAKSERLRTNAVFSIGQSGASNRAELLEDIYKSSMDNSRIRQQAVQALGMVREPAAVTFIGNVALTDPDIDVRKQAVFMLGQSRTPEAGQALEKLLQKK